MNFISCKAEVSCTKDKNKFTGHLEYQPDVVLCPFFTLHQDPTQDIAFHAERKSVE